MSTHPRAAASVTPRPRPAASSSTGSSIGSKTGQHSQMITGTVCTILGSRRPVRHATIGGVRSGGWFEYGPGLVRRRRPSALSSLRGGPFRMIELNFVGWSALLAPLALGGGVGGTAWCRCRVISISRSCVESQTASAPRASTSPSMPQILAGSQCQTQTARTSTTGGSSHVSAGRTVCSPPWTTQQRLGLPTDEDTGPQAGASPGVPPGATPGVRRCRELSPAEPYKAVRNAKAATLPARRTPGVHDRPLLSTRASASVPAVAIDLPHRRVGPAQIAGDAVAATRCRAVTIRCVGGRVWATLLWRSLR
jgi:hypothetical protein